MSKRNEPIEILIVEDEPEWLKGLEAIYRQIFRDNVNVTVALNRQTALEALKRVEERRRPLDVLSLDINLRHGESGVGKPPPSGLPVLRKAGQRTLARVAILVTAIARDYELRVAIPDDNERRQLRIGLGAYAKTLELVPLAVEGGGYGGWVIS